MAAPEFITIREGRRACVGDICKEVFQKPTS
jgi:hypothetical protein